MHKRIFSDFLPDCFWERVRAASGGRPPEGGARRAVSLSKGEYWQMPDGNRCMTGTIAIVVFLLLKGFFTMCETAVTEIPESRVKSFAGREGAEGRLYRLLQKPGRLLTTFSVHKVLSSVIVAYLAAVTYHQPLTDGIAGLLSPDGNAVPAAAVLAFLILILASALIMSAFCDGFPKRLLERAPEGFALRCAWAVRCLEIFLAPLSALAGGLASVTAALFGVSRSGGPDVVTEEEILMMVDAGNETGVIEQSQKDMITNIFEFSDLEVADVMTHRTDMTAVEVGDKVSHLVYEAINSGKSRIPVYSGDVDSVIGIVNVKDLLCLVGCEDTDGFSLRDFLREPLYVPETSKCAEVFERLSASRNQMAVVVDEYGGTAGLVTMEDLLESIVGNIQDEYDDEDEELEEISPGVFTIDGTASPDPVLAKLGITLPEHHDYDTMGGFLIGLLGRIPSTGETPSVEYEGVEFTVLITEEKRIARIKAEILSSQEPENPEGPSGEHSNRASRTDEKPQPPDPGRDENPKQISRRSHSREKSRRLSGSEAG